MSYNIKHKVGIKTTAGDIYQALTTNEGLASWWTDDVTGAGDVGAVIAFRFNGGGPDFKVESLAENKQVIWAHHGNMPEAWVGTEIVFDIEPTESQCFVHFQHKNWQSDDAFFAHCNTKWGVFLLSLKDFLETGTGRPFPNDTQIDHS